MPPVEISVEAREALLCMDLIEYLQEQRVAATEYQEVMRNAADKALQPVKKQSILVEVYVGDDHAPDSHDRLVFCPREEVDALAGISMVVARFPRATEDYYPEAPLGGRWNDIFLEVWDMEGIPRDYLLNGAGFRSFSASDEIISQDAPGNDLFAINQSPPVVHLDTLNALSMVLSKDQYVYGWQDSNEQPHPDIF